MKRKGQAELPFGNGWGGKRKGAGPKPKGERAGVSHRERERLAPRFPVHVTMRLKRGVPSMRKMAPYRVLLRAFEKGCEKRGFRLVQYSVQSNHLHLICEGRDREGLARGLQGLFVRIARGLNKHWGRKGSLFADRYHDRILRTPREVRNALVYVLNNARRHGAIGDNPDLFSSGVWFDGWRGDQEPDHEVVNDPVVTKARTWLLTKGWRKHRLLTFDERPGKPLPAIRLVDGKLVRGGRRRNSPRRRPARTAGRFA